MCDQQDVTVIKACNEFYAPNGGPAGATTTLVFFVYQDGFSYFHLDVASAVTVLMFGMIMAFTMLQGWISRRWVFYG